ncbi:MAG: hypothetical protein D6739_02140 [Nitrospirae bacterium]|nr:MAG: hypothetical protein D6739_02140 [Nitrospirota bacterium]
MAEEPIQEPGAEAAAPEGPEPPEAAQAAAAAPEAAAEEPRRVLEAEEVDALLRGLGAEEVRLVGGGGGVRVRPYDLANPEACGLRPMPVLDLIAERAVSEVAHRLGRRLSYNVRCRSLPMQVREFGRFIRGYEPPAAVSILAMTPGAAPCCLVFEAATLYRMIDLIFGGKPTEPVKRKVRDLTRIEARTAAALAREMVAGINQAWGETAPVSFEWRELETRPQFTDCLPPNETCMVMHWEVDLGSGDGDEICLCMPYAALDPIAQLHQEVRSEEGEELRALFRKRLQAGVRELPVTFTARLATVEVPLRVVRGLKVGDLLPLNRRPSDPVVGLLEGVPKYLAVSGTYNGSRAVQILKPVKQEVSHG